MKKFIKYDYYAQLFFLITGVIVGIVGFSEGWFIFSYFIIGLPQLLSYLIRLFLKTRKTIVFYIYGISIMPVWVAIFSNGILESESDIAETLSIIGILAFFYSPVMSLLYFIDIRGQFEKLKIITNEDA